MSKSVVTGESQSENLEGLESRASLTGAEREFLGELNAPGDPTYLVEMPSGEMRRVPSVEDVASMLEGFRSSRGALGTSFEADVLEYDKTLEGGEIVYEYPASTEDMAYDRISVDVLDDRTRIESLD
jgi:hypothetical protein